MKRQITYNNTRIIQSNERRSKAVKDIYPSQHLLTYIREGLFKVKYGKETRCYKKGDFVLIKKFTPATITKTWCPEGIKFSSVVFIFHEDLVNNALNQLNYPFNSDKKTVFQPVIGIDTNPILQNFIASLQLFWEDGVIMDDQLARLKTIEALVGMAKTDPSITHQLLDFSQPSKADLHHFMKKHFLENKKLEEYARESGRSLSTFKKDFQSLFGTSPARWLKTSRLEHAYKILSSTSNKPSEIYLQCGFEDLAHFSKSFKSHFGVNPSQLSDQPLRQAI